MAYPTQLKYKFAKEVQAAAAQLSENIVQLNRLNALATTRGWLSGSEDAIVDADLNPTDATIGPALGITAAQLQSMINNAVISLNSTMTSSAVQSYINAIRSDI